jgi:hypothetical protein
MSLHSAHLAAVFAILEYLQHVRVHSNIEFNPFNINGIHIPAREIPVRTLPRKRALPQSRQPCAKKRLVRSRPASIGIQHFLLRRRRFLKSHWPSLRAKPDAEQVLGWRVPVFCIHPDFPRGLGFLSSASRTASDAYAAVSLLAAVIEHSHLLGFMGHSIAREWRRVCC